MAAPVVIVAKKAVKVAIKIAIRKVIEFVTDPEESVSKIVLFIIGICSIFFILVILLCGTTSAVNGYVVNKAEAFFESDLYKEIEKADRRFIYKERSDLISYLLSSLPEENTESGEADPSEDGSESSERPSESAEETLARYHITVEVTAPPLAYTLAYINHADYVRSKWGNIFHLHEDEDAEDDTLSMEAKDIRKFYKKITYIEKETYLGADGTQYTLYHTAFLSPEKIAEKYWEDDSFTQQMFLASIKQYCDMLGISTESDGRKYTSLNGIPHYFQGDYRHVPYGSGTIASCGCGPTCVAMCLSYKTGDPSLTPDKIVAIYGNKYYQFRYDEAGNVIGGEGSLRSIFAGTAKDYGILVTFTSSIEEVKQALLSGKPVVARVKEGHFTSNGHFVVLAGYDSSQRIIKMNNPNRGNFNRYGRDIPESWVWTDATAYFIYQ